MNESLQRVAVFAAVLAMAFLVLVQPGCESLNPLDADGLEGDRKDPVENLPPETYLTIDVPPGELPDTSTSRKTLHWWGEDPDGRVVAYRYRWGKINFEVTDTTTVDSGFVPFDTVWINEEWVDTTAESVEFILPIRTAGATFTFQVKAIDNDGEEDPDPARLSFPVVNSRPTVEFRFQSNPLTVRETYKTFTVRTFVWDGADPDGNETLDKYFYSLDPAPADTGWIELDRTENSVTLRDLDPVPHVFWLMARDVAGFESARVHFPDSSVSTDPEEWLVVEPIGDYLIVDDFTLDASNTHLDYYKEIFDGLYGLEGEAYSIWELGNELPFSTVDVTESLLFFNRILWFSYYGSPHLIEAFNSLSAFINTAGKRMLLTTWQLDSLMVPEMLDSLFLATPTGSRLLNSAVDTVFLEPEPGLSLPRLQMAEIMGREVYTCIPAAGVEVIYRLDEDTNPTPIYEGTPVVGIRREDHSYIVIFMPLYLFRGYNNVGEAISVLLGG